MIRQAVESLEEIFFEVGKSQAAKSLWEKVS